MTHAWHQSIDIHEKLAQQLIESQDHLTVNTIHLLDEGWDNLVYLVNNSIIFRFPRREFGVMCMENEIMLLPYIASQVEFPISTPKWIGHPTATYPYPFSGYQMLAGQAVSDSGSELINNSAFAVTLASWLRALHAIPIQEQHIGMFKGDQGWRYDVNHRISRCREMLTKYESYFLDLGFSKTILLDIIDVLPKLTFTGDRTSYLHGDLYSRHVLMNAETQIPTGLIDWGDTHIGHPGIDLAVGMIFSKETFQQFLKAYGPVDSSTFHLLLLHAFCHHMSFLPYTCERDKPQLRRWASIVLARVMDEIWMLF